MDEVSRRNTRHRSQDQHQERRVRFADEEPSNNGAVYIIIAVIIAVVIIVVAYYLMYSDMG